MSLGPTKPARLHRTVGVAVAVAFAITFAAAGCGGTTNRSEREKVLLATADATVTAAEPRSNFGQADELRVDGQPDVRTYVRFDLGTPPHIRRATLRLYARSSSPAPIRAAPLADPADWSEDALTYATAPTAVAAADDAAVANRSGHWLSFDVTHAVRGRGQIAFVLTTTGATNVALASREAGDTHAPRLILDEAASPNAGGSTTSTSTTTETAPPSSTTTATPNPRVAAFGDIACDPSTPSFDGGNGTPSNCRQRDVARLVERLDPTAILTLGDTQYESGNYPAFLKSFDKTFGRFKPLIHPTVGNHEYLTPEASGYFHYFGQAAGPRDRGYYSFDIGSWHLISLNSECSHVGGCERGSPQETWLRDDLARHRNRCTLAYWHEPRFSSGEHGSATQMETIWSDLIAAQADVVLSGHNHDYERFAPLGENGEPRSDGIREFVVGTGGKNHYAFTAAPLPGEEVRNDRTFGALELELQPSGYRWRFVPIAGQTFTDAGSGSCH